MARLTKIIIELQKVIKENDMAIDDVTLFQEACSFLRGEKAQKNKEKSNESPASEAQIKLLKDLKLVYPKAISKQEATILIKENIGKKR